jgi:hypothetical protein
MTRRVFSTAVVVAVGFVTLQLVATAQEGRRRPERRQSAEHTEHLEAYQKCAQACSDCQRACDMCATHCAHLMHAGQGEHMTTLATCLDCADFCAAAAQIVARGGPFAGLMCQSCAEACARCAEACEKFPDDEHMKKCAEECRKCEKACLEMVQHLG